MKKSILTLVSVGTIGIMSVAYGATVTWTKAGLVMQERSSAGAIRYRYVTEQQFKNACTAPNAKPAPDPRVIPPVIPPPPPPMPPSPIVQQGLMPAVDTRLAIAPQAGWSDLRIRPNGEVAQLSDVGAFRIQCQVSHMNNDDPMVFPGIKDATHHHTYYGHTGVKFDTDLMTLANSGTSTCHGGAMNKSAYWHPTMIDSRTNAPVLPNGNTAMFYYKTGYGGVAPRYIQPPPKGLRILTGNPRAINPNEVQNIRYVCINPVAGHSEGRPRQSSIPNCSVGHDMLLEISFPQCWDGKNLDSPNHKDHMAQPVGSQTVNGCPVSHPVPIPQITLNMNFRVTSANQSANWRLSSDNYAFNGNNAGYSGHADWVNGWDEAIFAGIVRNCLNTSKDCKAHLLGDGRVFYGNN